MIRKLKDDMSLLLINSTSGKTDEKIISLLMNSTAETNATRHTCFSSISLFFTWSVCSWLANPLNMKMIEKPVNIEQRYSNIELLWSNQDHMSHLRNRTAQKDYRTELLSYAPALGSVYSVNAMYPTTFWATLYPSVTFIHLWLGDTIWTCRTFGRSRNDNEKAHHPQLTLLSSASLFTHSIKKVLNRNHFSLLIIATIRSSCFFTLLKLFDTFLYVFL